MRLTYPLLQNAKPQSKPYKLRDRDSMYLRVSVPGSKVWKFDYRLGGKDCRYSCRMDSGHSRLTACRRSIRPVHVRR
ncbi:Arm DNA-binding domain-containing protein [Paraburkholderia sp. BR14320]|uniref:Arm DNA-binding domain-containing protein n=1 Tax=unclassified Paraburkholderia TaxID=2615204 RepID=UPI0034CF8627